MRKTPLQRANEKISIDESTGCWIWTGSTSNKSSSHPYGNLKVDGKMVYAHRFLYAAHKGPIPPGMQIDHLCRNTKCCNPEHLEVVTPRENTIRGANAKTHCAKGHDWTPENHVVNGKGHRTCKICSNFYWRRWKEARDTSHSS